MQTEFTAMRQIMYIAAKPELIEQDAKILARAMEGLGFEQERAAVLISHHWDISEETIQQWIRPKLLKQ